MDQVLLEKLEVRRFGDGKTKKVPAGGSYSIQEEEEVVDQFSDEEMVSSSDEEMGVEETELKKLTIYVFVKAFLDQNNFYKMIQKLRKMTIYSMYLGTLFFCSLKAQIPLGF